MRSAPDAPDDDRPSSSGPVLPKLITDGTGAVGFVDAPDVPAVELVAAAVAAFGELDDGATLTVYSRLSGVDTLIADLVGEHAVVVIASIPHPSGGTTLMLRRAEATDDAISGFDRGAEPAPEDVDRLSDGV